MNMIKISGIVWAAPKFAGGATDAATVQLSISKGTIITVMAVAGAARELRLIGQGQPVRLVGKLIVNPEGRLEILAESFAVDWKLPAYRAETVDGPGLHKSIKNFRFNRWV